MSRTPGRVMLAFGLAAVAGGATAGLVTAAPRTLSAAPGLSSPVRLLPPLDGPLGVQSRPEGAGGRLPADWRDRGTWWPALGVRGGRTTTLGLYLGPTAGWLACHYTPAGVAIAGRPMTYSCAATDLATAGSIRLVAPLVHTATGWWEQAATNSRTAWGTYAVFRRATLRQASNGAPWGVTPGRVLVRIQAPPPPPAVPTVGLRPGNQRVPAGHPAGITVTGSNWPAGAYAVLWDLTDNINKTPTRSDECFSPNCQWMVPWYPPGTYQFGVYLHNRLGQIVAQSVASPVSVTWSGGTPPTPPPTATPTPTPLATATPTPTPLATATPTPTPVPTATPAPSVPTETSDNWSGYIAGGSFTGATAQFTVPQTFYSASQSTSTAEWVGIDGWGADTPLIQTGVDEIYDPTTNLVTLQAWWEVLPQYQTEQLINMDVSPGDTMTATVGQVSGTDWSMTLTDDTTGATYTIDQPFYGSGATAEWILEADTSDGAIRPLGDFSPAVEYWNLRFGGTWASLTRTVMVQGGVQVATPSAFDPTTDAFTVAYGSGAPPAP